MKYYHKRVCLLKEVEGKPMYLYKFNFAEDYKKNPDNKKAYKNINETVNKFTTSNC